MTRAATGDTVVVRPTNNICSVLVIAATLATAVALIVVVMRARALEFPLFGS
jgi:EamA domain-containing membrane protein RarD